MDEEMESTVLDTSGNGPAPVVDSAPVDTSASSVTEEQTAPAQSMEVISVDELLGRLTVGDEAEEHVPASEDEADTEESPEAGGTESTVEYEGYTAPSDADTALELLEIIQKDVSPHPFLATNFADYTVTEGLLLMALLLAVISLCVKMLKEGFSWL